MRRAWVDKVVEAADADVGVAALRAAWRAARGSAYYGLAWVRDHHEWPRALGVRGGVPRAGQATS
jgi:hypothetical protein